jgi:hypothetical protein
MAYRQAHGCSSKSLVFFLSLLLFLCFSWRKSIIKRISNMESPSDL